MKSKSKKMESKCKCGNMATRKFEVEPDTGFIVCCNSSKCEKRIYNELHELNERQKYYQGKSSKNYETSAKLAGFSIIGLSVIAIIYCIWKIVNNFVH